MGASHHGNSPGKDSELMKRFLSQLEGRAQREYTRGRLGPTDDGSLSMAIAADPAAGIVRIDFGKAVEWLGLPPKEAVALTQLLIQKAREISPEPITVEL